MNKKEAITVNTLHDTAILKHNETPHLKVKFNREVFTEFVMSNDNDVIHKAKKQRAYSLCSKDNKPLFKVFESVSDATNKWTFEMSWGTITVNPRIDCHLTFNGIQVFQHCFIQIDGSYGNEVNLAIYWDESLRYPKNESQYSFLVHAAQICLGCLHGVFKVTLTKQEKDMLSANGFKNLPIVAITKKNTKDTFPEEMIEFNGKKNKHLLKEFYLNFGFEERDHQNDIAYLI